MALILTRQNISKIKLQNMLKNVKLKQEADKTRNVELHICLIGFFCKKRILLKGWLISTGSLLLKGFIYYSRSGMIDMM